jgi:two-component system chemotaxis response regulator CheY
MKILVVEDELVTRTLLKRLLTNMSLEVVEAGDGMEALEKLESENPDLLLTDLQMPGLGGRMLIQTVRASKEHRLLPIVCMSAVKDKQEIVDVMALGIQGYILKPINTTELNERFRRVIAEHGGWRSRLAASSGRQTVMLVDPNASFREVARPILERTFTVVEAPSGPQGLRVFKESDPRPSVVIVTKDLPMVGEEQFAHLVRTLAESMQIPAPQFWLCVSEDAPAGDLPSGFTGQITRSPTPEALAAELERTLLAGLTPSPTDTATA